MSTQLAKMFGQLAVAFMCLAGVYYVLRVAFVRMQRDKIVPVAAGKIKRLIPVMRKLHPYAGGAALLLAAVHGVYLWQGVWTPKIALGAADAGVVALIGVVGLLIKQHPADITLRRWHLSGAVLLLLVLAAHVLINKRMVF